MNRRIFSFNIQGKLLVAFLVAVLIPVVLLIYASYTYARDLSLLNLESYVAASGAKRQEAIENDFRAALSVINNFLGSVTNEETMLEPLTTLYTQNTLTDFTLQNEVENLFTDQLITSQYFNSVWLLTPGRDDLGTDARPFAPVTAPNAELPFSQFFQEENQSDIFRVGRNLINNQTINDALVIEDTQALLVTQRADGSQRVEVINLLFNEINGENVLVGYLVVDLDLDRIILENLEEQIGDLETYAYVVLPRTNQVYASDAVLAEGLVDVGSAGAQRVFNREPSNTDTYTVNRNGDIVDVIGYYAAINVEEERFSLVSEIETNIVQQQLVQYATTIAFPVVLGSIILIFLSALLMNQLLTPTLLRLRDAIRGITRGNFEVEVTGGDRGDEVGQLANAILDMRVQVQGLTEDMERRLQIRTRDVRVTQDITRAATAERDLTTLMNRVVDLIVENFPSIYHAQIFLIDTDRQFAVLRASTGEAGRSLLARGHKLAVGSVSVIGQVTEQGQLIVARDTAESDVHRRNEFLRETLAELAIPLRLGENIIGALDVQSKLRDAFDQDQITTLQTLSDQITIAIENARLYQESARLLVDIENNQRAETRRAWQEYLYRQRQGGITTQYGTDTGYRFDGLAKAVYDTGKPAVGEQTERNTIPFAVPILLRGEVLGVSEYEVPEANYSYDKVLLAQELVNRLAIGLNNARLFQDSRQTVERERLVNEISAKLTGSTDVQDILETALREVGQALRTSQVAIRLQPERNGANGKTSGNGHRTPSDESETQP